MNISGIKQRKRKRKQTINKQQQLKKKLQAIKSIPQLKIILKSSKQQNVKLFNDVKQLKLRIDELKRNRRKKIEASRKSKGTVPQIQKQEQLDRLYDQLDDLYEEMRELKQQLEQQKGEQDPQAQHKKKKNMNEIASIDKQIDELMSELDILEEDNQRLNQTIQNNEQNENTHQKQIQQLQGQNEDLKAQIADLKKKSSVLQFQSIKVQKSLVDIRGKQRQLRQSLVILSKPQVVNQLRNNQNIKKTLISQVHQLKKKVEQQSVQLKGQYQSQKREVRNLITQNKQHIKNFKQLQKQKVKFQQQNNYWKKKWSQINKSVQKILNKNIKKVIKFTQTLPYEEEKRLRRDFIGVLNQNRFDDRQILKQNKLAHIQQVKVYENDKGIVAIRAYYDNNQVSDIWIPDKYLEKCRTTLTQQKVGTFIQFIKAKYNKIEARITKLQIRTTDDRKYQFGDKKSWDQIAKHESLYQLDIQQDQFPVSMFGSLGFNKTFGYFLEGLGFQINFLPASQIIVPIVNKKQ